MRNCYRRRHVETSVAVALSSEADAAIMEWLVTNPHAGLV